jgi:glycosyltransferase involved in cell wall biosynthesis
LPLSVSIIIPAYNEEKRLPSTLTRVEQYVATQNFSFVEVLVVDDGSQDGTAALVENRRDSLFRLVRNPGNRGKGYAIRNGATKAKGDWVLFSDADLSAPIEELDTLYRAATNANAEVAIGSRALDRSRIKVRQPAFRDYSGRIFNFFVRSITRLRFHDTQCGFKLFSKRAAQAIFSRQVEDGFSFDVELLVIARRLGLKAIEVPVEWSDVAGTKVSFAKGLTSFLDVVRIRARDLRGGYC